MAFMQELMFSLDIVADGIFFTLGNAKIHLCGIYIDSSSQTLHTVNCLLSHVDQKAVGLQGKLAH